MHLPTLIVVTLAINAIIGAYLYTIYQRKPKDRCFLFWSLSCASFVTGGILSALRTFNLPSVLTYFIADLLLIAAPILIFIGLVQFSRVRFNQRRKQLAAMILALYACILFVFHNDPVGNAIIAGAALVLVFMACALLLAKSIFIEPIFTRLLKNIFLLHCLTIILQTLLFINAEQQTVFMAMSNSAKFMLLSHIVLTTFTALILPWLSFLRLERKLTLKTQRDGLTNIANRNHFFHQSKLLWRKDKDQKLVIMMIDIDNFKLINDQFGHVAGDIAIKDTVKLLSKQLRSSDLLGRVGGEEFAVVLPRTNIEIGKTIASRLLCGVEKNTIELETQNIQLTISIGFVEAIPSLIRFDDAYKAADEALYKSKNTGRNKVTVDSVLQQANSSRNSKYLAATG